jgi:hypothetical protein
MVDIQLIDTKEELKRLSSELDAVMTTYYPFYSKELDERLEETKYAVDAEIERLEASIKKGREKKLEKVL